ncbi:uncharacterized protein LOC110432310 isoform X2 [Sorghum bicolor]|uniref:uncharacterized protein LOC110432310 isoform X2 n=1 Tax=Sorghum bicolor TaxID=4558 RepID=UPI000B4260D3|nr:uncharacterized protein LOC110432310 isoform X2 [Sorghum bicolor]|eukprot:XP_021308160.1 uncharacterized protein LOC110432310 isoform X2 [Sorghum bicolor]
MCQRRCAPPHPRHRCVTVQRWRRLDDGPLLSLPSATDGGIHGDSAAARPLQVSNAAGHESLRRHTCRAHEGCSVGIRDGHDRPVRATASTVILEYIQLWAKTVASKYCWSLDTYNYGGPPSCRKPTKCKVARSLCWEKQSWTGLKMFYNLGCAAPFLNLNIGMIANRMFRQNSVSDNIFITFGGCRGVPFFSPLNSLHLRVCYN